MSEDNAKVHHRKVRSFVRRDSRLTDAQRQALEDLWPKVGLSPLDSIDLAAIFSNNAPTILEIGFGSGQSLLQIAKQHPEQNFIGIETYRPGIGALLQGMQLAQLENIRVFYADAVEVLKDCILDNSLAGVQIFFPDPWPKRRHQKRRLVQPDFISRVAAKLKPQGVLHLATDWEDYAHQMMDVLSACPLIKNLTGKGQFANRSLHRPIITKFEQRGQSAGRLIWELQFERIASS